MRRMRRKNEENANGIEDDDGCSCECNMMDERKKECDDEDVKCIATTTIMRRAEVVRTAMRYVM